MMWVLKKYDDGEQGVFYFLPNREYSIGRKGMQLLVRFLNEAFILSCSSCVGKVSLAWKYDLLIKEDYGALGRMEKLRH